MPLHSHVSSSRLVSLLAGPASARAGLPAQDFAESLGQWLGPLDAIRLRSALQAIDEIAGTPPPHELRPDGGELAQALALLRTALAGAIDADAAAIAGRDRPAASASPSHATAALRPAQPAPDPALEYAPYRRRHLDQQRRMEARIGTLRTQARRQLSKASPGLQRLAALDTALDETFGEREQQLLATLPALAERCFERRLEAHRQALQASGQPDRPQAWRQPSGWLDTFGEDWRRILLAELELRLEPVAGLIEAFDSEAAQCQ